MASPTVMVVGKDTSNPLTFNDSPLTGVNTPGSDENSMKLMVLMYILSFAAVMEPCSLLLLIEILLKFLSFVLMVEGNPLLYLL